MNYLKQYIKLIRKAQKRLLSNNIYKEKHHVFPVSLYGKNKLTVELTYKEHVVAHHLIYMGFKQRYGEKDIKTIAMSRAFHAMLKYKRKYNKNSISNIIHKLNNKKILKGINNPSYGKRGKLSPNFGKKNSKETRKKISLSWTEERRNNQSEICKQRNKMREIRFNTEKFNWINVFTGDIEYDKTASYLKEKYKNMRPIKLWALENNKLKMCNGWTFLERFEKDEDFFLLYKNFNWMNINTNEFLLNTNAYTLNKKYKNTILSELRRVLNDKLSHHKGWMRIKGDNKKEYLEKYKFKGNKRNNWINFYTEEIEMNKTIEEMKKKYPEIDKGHLGMVKSEKKFHHRGWTLLKYSLYDDKIPSKYRKFDWLNIETNKIETYKNIIEMCNKYPELKQNALNRLTNKDSGIYKKWKLTNF